MRLFKRAIIILGFMTIACMLKAEDDWRVTFLRKVKKIDFSDKITNVDVVRALKSCLPDRHSDQSDVLRKVHDQLCYSETLRGDEAQVAFKRTKEGVEKLWLVPDFDFALKAVAKTMLREVVKAYDDRVGQQSLL